MTTTSTSTKTKTTEEMENHMNMEVDDVDDDVNDANVDITNIKNNDKRNDPEKIASTLLEKEATNMSSHCSNVDAHHNNDDNNTNINNTIPYAIENTDVTSKIDIDTKDVIMDIKSGDLPEKSDNRNDNNPHQSQPQPQQQVQVQVSQPPKRTQRARNPVVFMQSEHFKIYDEQNNRKLTSKSTGGATAAATTTTTTTGGGVITKNNQTQSNASKKRKAKDINHKNIVKAIKKSSSTSTSASTSTKYYHWIGSPISPPTQSLSTIETTNHNDNNKNTNTNYNKTYYQKLEINVGNHPALIKINDFVLVSSSDYNDADLYDKPKEKKINSRYNVTNKVTNNDTINKKKNLSCSPVNTKSRNDVLRNMIMDKPHVHNDTNDDDDDYNCNNNHDPIFKNLALESEEEMEVVMNKLNPYIGRIEELYEDHDCEDGTPFANMKYRIRWFYKRDDVLSLRGQFIGVSRQQLVKSMTRRDILLGEQRDVNDITTILGKCKVIQLKPFHNEKQDYNNADGNNYDYEEELKIANNKGAFHCRYNISIQPPTKSSRKGIITITPYEELTITQDEDESVSSFAVGEGGPPVKRARAHSTASQGTQGSNVDRTTVDDGSDNDSMLVTDISKSADAVDEDDDDDDSSQSVNDKRSRADTPPPITEGSGTLKIKVGPDHQAIIPSQLNKRRYTSNRKAPILVWKPHSITEARLKSYLEDATTILKDYMNKNKITMTRSLPHNIPPGVVDGDDSDRRSSSQCEYREFDVDDLLYLLHDHDYNSVTALRGLKKYPEDYLYIWTKEEKELYDAGFVKHERNLHAIGKILSEYKNHKDVVDYHYRFKIPDQFKRYQDLKREQTRRMIETVERLKLNEYLSDDFTQGNGSNNGTKRGQQWSKAGGGGTDNTGEIESRRLKCKDFLLTVREKVGANNYLTIVNMLKSLNAQVLSVPQVKEGFSSILKDHPNLLEQFESYLPSRFRT